MAEEEAVFEAKVVGDWAEFDRQTRERERAFETFGVRIQGPAGNPGSGNSTWAASWLQAGANTFGARPNLNFSGPYSSFYMGGENIAQKMLSLGAMGLGPSFIMPLAGTNNYHKFGQTMDWVGGQMQNLMEMSGFRDIWNQSPPLKQLGFWEGGAVSPAGGGNVSRPRGNYWWGGSMGVRTMGIGVGGQVGGTDDLFPQRNTAYAFTHELGHHFQEIGDPFGTLPIINNLFTSGLTPSALRQTFGGYAQRGGAVEGYAEAFAQSAIPRELAGQFGANYGSKGLGSLGMLYQAQLGGAESNTSHNLNEATDALQRFIAALTEAAQDAKSTFRVTSTPMPETVGAGGGLLAAAVWSMGTRGRDARGRFVRGGLIRHPTMGYGEEVGGGGGGGGGGGEDEIFEGETITGGAGARLLGEQRRAIVRRAIETVNIPGALPGQRMLPAPNAIQRRNRVYEGEEVEDPGTAMVGGGGGPGSTPPGRGPRMWVPTGPDQPWYEVTLEGNPPGPTRWQRFSNFLQRIPHRAVFSAIFGLWEVAQIHRASQLGQLQTALATSPEDQLNANVEMVRNMTRGPLSGTLGTAMDLIGGGINTVFGTNFALGPSAIIDRAMQTMAIEQRLTAAQPLILARRGQIAVNAAYASGGTGAMQLAQIHQQRLANEAVLTQQAAFLEQQANARSYSTRVSAFNLLTSSPEMRAIFGGPREQEFALDDATRAANMTLAAGIRGQIATAQDQEEIQKQQYQFQNAMQGRQFRLRAGSAFRLMSGMTSQDRALMDLAQQQGIELQQTANDRPELLPELRKAQAQEFAALQFQNRIEMMGWNEQTNTVVDAANLRAGRRPFQALLREIAGRAREETIANATNPEKWAGIIARMNASLGEARAAESHEVRTAVDSTNASIAAIGYAIANQPLKASLAALNAERIRSIASIPLDRPDQITATENYYDARARQINHQYNQQRFLETQSLDIQEQVTGLTARAKGLDAGRLRREAALTAISRGAEFRAEQRLLSDASDMANADRERRIGVNQLQTYKNDYLRSLQTAEGSLNRTNFSVKGGSSPEQIMQQVDNHIVELTRKIGTLVAVP